MALVHGRLHRFPEKGRHRRRADEENPCSSLRLPPHKLHPHFPQSGDDRPAEAERHGHGSRRMGRQLHVPRMGPYLQFIGAAFKIRRDASRILFFDKRQASVGTHTALSDESGCETHCDRDSSGLAPPFAETAVRRQRLAERLAELLRMRKLHGTRGEGRQPGWPPAPFRERHRGGSRKGISDSENRHAGLSIHAEGAEIREARPQRDRAALLHRMLLRAWAGRMRIQPLLREGYRRLVENRAISVRLGLFDQFRAQHAALPEPADAQEEREILPEVGRPRPVRTGQRLHEGRRISGPASLSHRQAVVGQRL